MYSVLWNKGNNYFDDHYILSFPQILRNQSVHLGIVNLSNGQLNKLKVKSDKIEVLLIRKKNLVYEIKVKLLYMQLCLSRSKILLVWVNSLTIAIEI